MGYRIMDQQHGGIVMDLGDGYSLRETKDSNGKTVILVTLGDMSVAFHRLNPSSAWKRQMIYQAKTILAQFSEEAEHG